MRSAERLASMLRALAREAGVPLKTAPDFRLRERDPRQDMQYGESLRLCAEARPYRAARGALARICRAQPAMAEAWLLRGVVETMLARFRPAMAFLEKSLSLDAGNSWALAWRGVARALECRRRKTQEGLREALADLDAAAHGETARFVHPWRAELRHDLEDHAGALGDLERILREDGKSLWARVERGEILCETGRHAEALAEFERLVRENPRSSWAYALRGRTLATSGREAESLADLERAAKLDPRSASARAWLGESLRKLGRYGEALEQLDKALRLDPRFTLAWVWRGRVRLLLGRLKEGVSDLERALRLDPRYQLAYAWRGEALWKLGRRKLAEKDFARVAPLDLRRTWNPLLGEGERLTSEARERAYARDREDAYDLVVIGAGPAGCTLAALVKKHDAGRRVLIVEKATGPRHHIGESLLPGIIPILKEMGVFEKIDSAGFPRKIGANYVWGRGREVWENDFNDVNVREMLERRGGIPEKLEYAWQVRRSKYDEILLKHAEELGVEVLRGTVATSVIEENSHVVGVRVKGAKGPERELRCEFLADCSGQSGFLSRHKRIREYNPGLKNVACYAYYRGAPWKYRYNGHPDKTKIFVCSVDSGWFWYIPIAKDVVSVGLVTSQENLRREGVRPEELFVRELARCGEIAPLLASARRLKDFDGAGQEFFTVNDWSYLNVAAAGPGWLACGDAAVFVDPILSSGVTLAHLGAQRAAYTLLTHWREADASLRARLWSDYGLYCRESAEQFLALALFWYGNDRLAEKWWGRAKELQRAWLPVAMSDQQAFITVSAGLTRFYERALTAAGLASAEPLRPKDLPFYVNVLGGRKNGDQAVEASATPRLLYGFEEEIVFFPAPEGGRLQPAKRVVFRKNPSGRGLSGAFNPRLIVTKHHLEVLRLIDGRRTAAQVLSEADRRGVPAWWLKGPAVSFLAELRLLGVLDESAPEAPGRRFFFRAP